MSLRRDIHAAFDEIAPPLGGMPERVVQTVLSDRQRRKKGMFAFRARVPVPLIAGLVAIALVVSGFVGVQLMQGWIATLGPTPAGHVHLTALQQLEARPFQIPTLAPGESCVPGPFTAEGNWGTGPLYGYSGSATTTNWGEYFYAVLYTDRAMTGPNLVRVEDLVRGRSMAFVGSYAAGPVIGSDVVDGTKVTQHSELVLNESKTTAGGWRQGWPIDHHRFVWDFMGGLAGPNGGPLGWQIDGAGFSETFRVC